MIKKLLAYWVIFSVSACLSAREVDYVLDFSESFNIDIVENLDARRKANLGTGAMLEGGVYKIILPSNVVIIAELEDLSYYRYGDDHDKVGRLRLITPILTYQEALALAETFIALYELDNAQSMHEWLDPYGQGKRSEEFWTGGSLTEYPGVGLSLHTSFQDQKPVFARITISFDQKKAKRRGNSIENNTITNLTFDMPAILASVREQEQEEAPEQVEPEVASSEAAPVTKAEASSTPVAEKPAEEQSEPDNSWLWYLFGAAIVGFLLALRFRKKK